MKTDTPDLDPAVLDRLRDYAARFADDFPQAKPARCSYAPGQSRCNEVEVQTAVARGARSLRRRTDRRKGE